MEFDWINPAFELDPPMTYQEVEESFEDPFSIRLLPDSPRFGVQGRFFNLGKSATGQGLFSVYRANGKVIRVIVSRPFTEQETYFYQRKLTQALAS
ncbi:MAG: hypothetical protein EXS25_01455 [Pedosphaera sp.]|nr:hypothetical protein [Pedosphaera sp.]